MDPAFKLCVAYARDVPLTTELVTGALLLSPHDIGSAIMFTMDEQRRVLVIDDSEVSLEMMAGVLEDAGLSVVTLPGPIGATQAVVKHQIPVLVTDVNMPELRGHNLISLFRQNYRTRHVKVILVSSLPERQLLELAKESGADGVVQKDRIAADLVSVVNRLLREYDRHAGTRAGDVKPDNTSPLSAVRERLAKISRMTATATGDALSQSLQPLPRQEVTEV